MNPHLNHRIRACQKLHKPRYNSALDDLVNRRILLLAQQPVSVKSAQRHDVLSRTDALPKFHRRLELHLLIITVHRLQHRGEIVSERGSAELDIIVRIETIVNAG